MQGGVCKTRTEMKYSCRAGFTNQIWKFYDNAMISTASLIRKRCCQDVYEFVVPFGFTNFVVPSFTMFKHCNASTSYERFAMLVLVSTQG